MPEDLDASRDRDLWIDTDSFGLILDWHPDAMPLLGYTARSLRGRSLTIMFLGDRPGVREFDNAMLGRPVEREGIIRPRDQRGVPVRYQIAVAPQSSDRRPVLRWTFQRL